MRKGVCLDKRLLIVHNYVAEDYITSIKKVCASVCLGFQECEYPKLYSSVYHRCLDFQTVQCGNRHEVMAPCEYRHV